MSSELHPNFVPNNDFLQAMLSMGISKEAAEIALYNTGNEFLDAAISYVFDNPAECSQSVAAPNSPEVMSVRETFENIEEREEPVGLYKMVFVVNGALEMSIGKTAAQVGHATLGLYRQMAGEADVGLEVWENDGEKKVVLKGQNHVHLMDLLQQAKALDLKSYLVQDAGRTEVTPGTVTVLGIFGKEEIVNKITGSLRLLV